MPTAQQVSLSEVLTEENLKSVGAKLAGLPTSEQFKKEVEQDLWEKLVGTKGPESDTVDYDSLSEESTSVIGYIETDDDEQKIPWWLASFKWQARSRGESITLQTEQFNDPLSNFENFDPAATQLQKPELQEDTFLKALKNLKTLGDELDEQFDIEEKSAGIEMPSNIFNIEEGLIETTEEFEQWFNDILRLCPPVNDELTALFMVNAGVSWEAAEGIVPEDLLERLKIFGFSSHRISERDYHNPIRYILELNGVFDLTIPVTKDYDGLGMLEALFYEHWAESNQNRSEDVSEWIEQASAWNPDNLESGEEPIFAKVAFTTPLRLSHNSPIYTTLRYTSSENRYFRNDGDKRREINEIMSSNGLLE